MSSYVLHGVGPTSAAAAVAFSLLGWLPWGTKQPPLQDADYSSKEAAKGPVPEARLKDVQVCCAKRFERKCGDPPMRSENCPILVSERSIAAFDRQDVLHGFVHMHCVILVHR